MPFAVMQESLDPPPTVEQLAQAFAAVPGLTRQDGALQAKDAFGILASHLSRERAAAMESALRTCGVDAVAVDEDALPSLPPPKILTRADLLPEALVLYDALGRQRHCAWGDVILIAAGNVLLSRLRTEVTEQPRTRRFGLGGVGFGLGAGFSMSVMVAEVTTKVEKTLNLQVEVFLNGHPNRYRISARQFVYTYLGSEAGPRAIDNFLRLFRDLVRLAPAAWRNRGAELLAAEEPRLLAYPSRHAFEEECVWWLWRRSLPAASAAPAGPAQ